MLRGTEVRERDGACRVAEVARQCAAQQHSRAVEVEILIRADRARQHRARSRSGVLSRRPHRQGEQERDGQDMVLHGATRVRTMFVIRTVFPDPTVTEVRRVSKPLRLSSTSCAPAGTRMLSCGVFPITRPSTDSSAHGVELIER